jgi:integrase/recombinase XerD
MYSPTLAEIRTLLDTIDLRAPMGPRDYFLIVFDYHTGLRVSELVSLNVSQVAEQGVPRHELFLPAAVTKNRQSRIVPLNELARKAISKLLAFNQARGVSVLPDAPLFQTKHHQRLTARTVQWMMADLRAKAGLDVPVTPHSLRHACLKTVLERSHDIRAVQKIGGQKRLSSVEVYTEPDREQVARAAATLAHPTEHACPTCGAVC